MNSQKARYASNLKPAEHRRRPIPRTKAISTWDGWVTFISQLVIAFGFLIFGLAHFSFASSGPIDQLARSSQVSVNGKLSWDDGVGKIQDKWSGRVYVLAGADGLKALYDSGVRNVAVAGSLGVHGDLHVDNVSTP